MSLEPVFHVRSRGGFTGLGLLALCAALTAGFVASASGGSDSRHAGARLAAPPSSKLAMCLCPDADDRPPPRR